MWICPLPLRPKTRRSTLTTPFSLVKDVLSTMFSHALNSGILYSMPLGECGKMCNLQYAEDLLNLTTGGKEDLKLNNQLLENMSLLYHIWSIFRYNICQNTKLFDNPSSSNVPRGPNLRSKAKVIRLGDSDFKDQVTTVFLEYQFPLTVGSNHSC